MSRSWIKGRANLHLFTIHCLSCRSRLKVLDASAIGTIVACPKCGSMVPVKAPAGWQPPAESALALGAAPAVAAPDPSSADPSAAIEASSPTASAPAVPVAAPAPSLRFWQSPLVWAAAPAGFGLLSLALWLSLRNLPTGTINEPVAPATSVLVTSAIPDPHGHLPLDPIDPAEDTIAEEAGLTADKAEMNDAVDSALDENAVKESADPVDAALADSPADDVANAPTAHDDEHPPTDENPDAAPPAQPVHIRHPPTVAFSYRPVDVHARLADPIGRFRCDRLPLFKFSALISQLSTLTITLDADSLADAAVSLDAPISVDFRDGNIANLLTNALDEHKLAYEIAGDQLVIGNCRPDQEELTQKRHDIRTLVQSGCTAADLDRLVQIVVFPGTWEAAGGAGKVSAASDALTITHLPVVHRRVADLLERLQLARSSSTRDSDLRLKTRLSKVDGKLSRRFLTTFHRPTSIIQIFKHLETRGTATILVDWRSLLEAGVPPTAETTLSLDNQPLSVALGELLSPLGLGYRIVGDGKLEVLSLADLRSRQDVEFYPVSDLAENAAEGTELLGRIRAELLLPAKAPDAAGVLLFDVPSRSLIARQPFDVHARLAALLAAWRADHEPAAR